VNTHPQRQSTSLNIFWGKVSPCEHPVQIYDEAIMLDSLEGFIHEWSPGDATGFFAGFARDPIKTLWQN